MKSTSVHPDAPPQKSQPRSLSSHLNAGGSDTADASLRSRLNKRGLSETLYISVELFVEGCSVSGFWSQGESSLGQSDYR